MAANQNLLVQLLITAKDQSSSVLQAVGQAVASLGRTILDAAKSAVDFQFPTLKASTDDAQRLEKQMGALRAAIDATGGAAGLTAEDIDVMARNLDEATLGSAEGFRNAAVQLLTFKRVGADAFERTLKAAQDLSAAGFGTVESATVQLGKALENPVQGLTALTRVGVSFTAEQQNMIDSFVRLGDVAGAQNVILAAVEGQVQGVAAAAGGGLAGAVDLVGKRMTDLRETIGGVLLPIMTSLNLVFADVVGAVQKAAAEVAGPLKAGAEQAGGALKALGEGIGQFLAGTLRDLASWITNLDWKAVQDGAASVGEKIAGLGQTFKELGSIAGQVIDTIKIGVNGVQIAFNAVVGGLQALVSGFLTGLAEIEGAASKVGLGTLERAAELRARAEEWKAYAAESIAAIQRDASQAGAAFDSLTGKTAQAAAAQRALGDSLPAAELQALNKTLTDYAALADRATVAARQAARDHAAGKIGAQEYGRAITDAAQAAQDLAEAQDAETTRQATAATKEKTAALGAQILALENAAKATDELAQAQAAARQASIRQIQAELELAKARGDTVAIIELTARLTAAEIQDAQALATAKRAEAENLREQIAKREALAVAQRSNSAAAAEELALLRAKLAIADAEAGAAEATAQKLQVKNQATAESTAQMEKNTAALQENAQQSQETAGAVREQAKSYTLMEDAAMGALRELSGLSAGMNSLVSTMLRVNDAGDSFGHNFRGELGKLNLQLEQTNQAIQHNLRIIGPYRDAFERNVDVANAARKAYLEQAIAATELAGRLADTAEGADTSTRALQSLVRQGTGAVQSMQLLDQQTLDRLKTELEAANERLRAMQEEADDARAALARLDAEIAAERGETEKAALLRQQLEYQQALAELEAKQSAARAAGNRELMALYDEQARKLAELNALKEKNIKADEAARRAQTTERASPASSSGGQGAGAPSGAIRTYNLNLVGANGRNLSATTTTDPAGFLDELERAAARSLG